MFIIIEANPPSESVSTTSGRVLKRAAINSAFVTSIEESVDGTINVNMMDGTVLRSAHGSDDVTKLVKLLNGESTEAKT